MGIDGKKEILISVDLPDSVDNALKNLTDKPTQMVGTIITDCLYLVFGGISQRAALKRVEYADALENFENTLSDKINKIPEDKRIEPDVQVVCTALNNVKYCVEVPELRDMFSTLIANSVNEERFKNAHPSYGEIIKQLTAFDANIIVWLKQQRAIPMIRLRIVSEDETDFIQLPDIYLKKDFDNHEKLQISLENLSRLKIIDLNFNKEYADLSLYDEIKQNKKYSEAFDSFADTINEEQDIDDECGYIEITHFGQGFISACCD